MSLQYAWNYSPNVTEDWTLTFLWDLMCSVWYIGVSVSEQTAALKMETANSSETLVPMYQTTWFTSQMMIILKRSCFVSRRKTVSNFLLSEILSLNVS
jgi:hypothetical protein